MLRLDLGHQMNFGTNLILFRISWIQKYGEGVVDVYSLLVLLLLLLLFLKERAQAEEGQRER